MNPSPTSAVDSAEDPLCALPQALPLHQARRVLALAPHPDDECIGCGGLLARLVQAGVAVRVVLVTDGSGAGGLPPGAGLVRQQEFQASLRHLGVNSFAMLNFPDGGLAFDAPLCEAIENEVRSFAPNWVLAPSAHDAHRDHRCVARAAQRAALANTSVETLLEFETWGALPATHVVDITDTFAAKMAALAEHRTALAQMDYASATEGLARYRALLLAPGRPGGAAEAYLCSDRDSGFAWRAGWGPQGV
jgi:LmbE family N-acetylglucosaminyl deacetylase